MQNRFFSENKEQEKKTDAVKKHGFQLTKENCLIVALAGILLLVAAWPVEKQDKSTQSVQSDSKENILNIQAGEEKEQLTAVRDNSLTSYTEYLEASLEKLLGTMEGVGKVQVMITLEGTGETIVEKDVLQTTDSSTEVDSAGGSRNTADIEKQETTVFYDLQTGETPFVRQVTSPKVAGVAVSAQGGGNAVIAGNIKKAIQALFGIDVHKIIIVKMTSQ